MRLAFGPFLLGATLTISGTTPVLAAAQDYVFEAVQSKVQESANAIISVRLINKVAQRPPMLRSAWKRWTPGSPGASGVTLVVMSAMLSGDMSSRVCKITASATGLRDS